MSTTYNIDIVLDMQYSKENIEKIITKGDELDYVYLVGINEKLVNTNEAVCAAMNSESDSENMTFLTAKLKDTYLNFYFYEAENKSLIFMLCPSAAQWKCQFNNRNNIDLTRYLDEILFLLKPFRILDLKFYIY